MTAHQQRLAVVIVFVFALSLPLLFIKFPPELTASLLAAWFVCLVVYVLADLLTSSVDDGLWVGYLNLATMTAWCISGLGMALILILVGAAVAAFLRAQLRLEMPAGFDGSIAQLAASRAAVSGIPVIGAAGIYAGLLNYPVPIRSDDLNLGAVVLALLVAFTLLQVSRFAFNATGLGLYLIPRHHALSEVTLLLAIVPFSLIHYDQGVLVFAILMSLVAGQIVRYHEVNRVQNTLVRRVDELSVLSGVNQNLSSNLVIEDVLQSLYEWVKTLADVPVFYFALYVSARHAVDFPLVVEGDQKVRWSSRRLSENDFLADVIERRTVIQIARGHAGNYAGVFRELPDDERHQLCVGIPLSVGTKTIGVLVLVTGSQGSLLTRVENRTLETIASQASLAIRNAMLYNQSVQLADNLREINRSVQDVMFNLDSQEGMQAACRTAMQIAKAQKVALFLLDPEDKNKTRLVHSIGLNPQHIHAYEGPIHAPVIYKAEPRVVDDVGLLDERDALVELAEIGEFSAMAEVALKSGNAPIGILTVFQEQPYPYQTTELELLETLAYQITAAIDYTELLGALELYASEQAQLVHLSRISTSSLELEKIADNVSQILQQMMSVDHVGIGLLLSGKNYLLVYEREGNESPVLGMQDIPEFATLLQQSQFGPRVYFHNDELISNELRAFMHERRETMLALVPMIANNDLLGVILLGREQATPFVDGEWRLMEMATNLLSTQLHNAQLYRFTQEALNRRLQQLALIEGIAQQISRTLDLDDIIVNVLEAAIHATQAETATLGLFTESGDFRVITEEFANSEWRKADIVRDHPAGLMDRAISSGKMLVVGDNSRESDYWVLDSYIQTYRSSLVVPLVADGRAIGVLNIESTELDFFNEERIDFVTNLAGHCMISIQNARLLQERQSQIDTLTELRELSLRLSMDTDKTSVANAILEAALDVLQGENAVLYYYYHEEEELVLLSSMGRDGDRYVNVRTVVPDAVALRSAQSGEIVIVEDVKADPDFQNDASFEDIHYASLIVVPIKHGSQVSEIMCVTLPRHRPYLSSELNKIELLAIQAAGHMANAALYEQIRTSSDRMRAILDSTRDGIILLDRIGTLVESNLSAESLLNIRLEDYLGNNFAETLLANLEQNTGAQSDSLREALTDMARILRLEPQRITNRSYTIEENGKTHYMEEVGSPVMDSHNHIMGRLLTLRDVTEEKLLAAYRDEISHMVVHDLRGPLGSIISSITLTLEVVNESQDQALRELVVPMMEVSLDSAMNLLQLVDSLLDIAKLETRRMPLKRTSTRVDDLIESAMRTLQTSARQADIVLEQSITDELPPVDVDSDKIRRVIINLLDNAVRFTPTGGKVLVTAGIAGSRKVVIRIADSGPGIPPDEVDRVFEKFRQVKNAIPAHGRKGSGLGLTFCKLAVEAHDEVIWIEQNGPLSGACFAFTLPIVSSDKAPEIAPSTTTPANP